MKISIITATHNSALTIGDTLQSILDQSYQDFEVLLQDSCSTDDTLAVVSRYAPQFGDRLKVESVPDSGIYDGLNKGIRRATGDVVGTLNSDDFYTSRDVLQTIVDTYRAHPTLDAVYADVHYVEPSNLKHIVRYYCSRDFTPERMKMGFMPAHPTFYCRRTCYEQYGYYDPTLDVASDFEFVLRLIYIHHIQTLYVPADWVTMRTGGASTSGLNSHKQIMSDHIRAFRKNGIPFNPFKYFWRYVEKLKELR